jgi:hypothetical protein
LVGVVAQFVCLVCGQEHPYPVAGRVLVLVQVLSVSDRDDAFVGVNVVEHTGLEKRPPSKHALLVSI